jgi:hypothetical protein
VETGKLRESPSFLLSIKMTNERQIMKNLIVWSAESKFKRGSYPMKYAKN